MTATIFKNSDKGLSLYLCKQALELLPKTDIVVSISEHGISIAPADIDAAKPKRVTRHKTNSGGQIHLTTRYHYVDNIEGQYEVEKEDDVVYLTKID